MENAVQSFCFGPDFQQHAISRLFSAGIQLFRVQAENQRGYHNR